MFLVSLATIDSSHGLNAEPSLNRPKEQYALKKACRTTSSASDPAPSAAAATGAHTRDHRTLVDDAAPLQDLPLCPRRITRSRHTRHTSVSEQ